MKGMRSRLRNMQPRTWAAITVLAFLFSVGWTWYANDQTEDSLRADLTASERANEPLLERVTVLEQFVELSNAELEACERNPKDCDGPVAPPVEDINPQTDGPRTVGPTFAQVQTAAQALLPGMVQDYLRANPPADGEDGEDSQVPGPPGADSTVPGPAGESITGPKGDEGRGIASMSCSGMAAPATFIITYTDGSTQEVQCQMLPPVDEDP